jgi:hypothetical protein
MGGGLMQLVAYGAQDVYLTGNPQITFFKVVYRRHTNFSTEVVELVFDGAVISAVCSSVTILRNGDLATRCTLKVTLNAVSLSPSFSPPQSRLNVAWVRRLGHALINNIDVEIGGSRIDSSLWCLDGHLVRTYPHSRTGTRLPCH